MRRYFQPISVFGAEPYSRILAYPRPSKGRISSRLKELEKLGITRVSFWGGTRIENLNILGKGYAGVVVLAKKNARVVALKIRRIDSQRECMKDEARLLHLANKAGVGPKLIASSRNFLVMEYLSGEKIGEWIAGAKGGAGEIKCIVRAVLEDCFRLDESGLDHGELNSMAKHAIVGTRTTIVDFESASTKRRVSNVTSATQGIFIGSGISKKINRTHRLPKKDRLISALRAYKKEQNRESFEGILKVLRI